VVLPDAAHDATLVFDAADPCSSACVNLNAIGCSDGSDFARCVQTCQHVKATHLIALDTMCLTSAKSLDAARACGAECR
jgi:hypothetical protein